MTTGILKDGAFLFVSDGQHAQVGMIQMEEPPEPLISLVTGSGYLMGKIPLP